MQIIHLYPGSFGSNCYLLESAGHALVVDPSAAAPAILRRLQTDGCVLDGVLLTHGHFDHIMSIDTLRKSVPGLSVWIHASDAPMLTDGDKNAFGTFFGQDRVWLPADGHLSDGQKLTIGHDTLEVIHTPGHSPGSVCFLCAASGILLTGDTIFAEGVGRWDLWGGHKETLQRSVASLHTMDPNLTVYAGHGEAGTLARSLRYASYYL